MAEAKYFHSLHDTIAAAAVRRAQSRTERDVPAKKVSRVHHTRFSSGCLLTPSRFDNEAHRGGAHHRVAGQGQFSRGRIHRVHPDGIRSLPARQQPAAIR